MENYKQKVARISELTAISRQRELTEGEKIEREGLRREYIDSVKQSLGAQLDNTTIIEPDGSKHKFGK